MADYDCPWWLKGAEKEIHSLEGKVTLVEVRMIDQMTSKDIPDTLVFQ